MQTEPVDPFGIIRLGSKVLGVPIDDGKTAKMARHLNLLLQWRARINLTSLADMSEIAVQHFIDSLTVFKVIPVGRGLRTLDIGTGAGFPGLVMRAADDSMKMTLMDRDPGKIVFLKYVTRDLHLDGVEFLNVNLLHLLEDPGPHRFDLVVSRAFSSSHALMDRFSSLLPVDGLLVRMAGPGSLKQEFPLRNFQQSAVWEGILPFSSSLRRVILYKRVV